MNLSDYILKSLKYIEDNIYDTRLSANKIARNIALSSSHYERAFSIFTGLPVGEYIRRRRLSLAGQMLQSGSSIIQTALKMGYDSPEAFSKAFQRLHGVTPKKIIDGNASMFFFPPLEIKVIFEGKTPLRYRILKNSGFHLLGKSRDFSIEKNAYEKEMKEFWDEMENDGSLDDIQSLSHKQEIVGASIFTGTAEGRFIYAVCAQTEEPHKHTPASMNLWHIDWNFWAVFEFTRQDPVQVDKIWNDIYTQWLPNIDYDTADEAHLEIYAPKHDSKEFYLHELWLPLICPQPPK